MKLLRNLRANMALICMGFGLFAAIIVLFSWLFGYWSNGLYGTKFEIDSCWQGLSACGMGLIGLFKWLVDSSKNSPVGEFPIAPKVVSTPVVDTPVVEQPVVKSTKTANESLSLVAKEVVAKKRNPIKK